MIYNATILRIDTPNGNTPGGDPVIVTGATVAIRCCQSDPTFLQRQEIDRMSLNARDVLFVETSLLPEIVAGSQMLILLDGMATSVLYIARGPKPSVISGPTAHWEIFLETP